MKSYIKILLFIKVGYVTFKDLEYIKIKIVNPLYFNINKINQYLKKVNGNKYLTLVPNNESKKIIKNMKNCGVKSKIRLEQ